jgi:hypothetical protein
MLAAQIDSRSVTAFLIVFFGYVLHSLLLQYFFYYKLSGQVLQWKTQPLNTQHLGRLWGFPLFSSKTGRGPYHRTLVTINLLAASTFALFTTECAIRGLNKMDFTEYPSLWEAIPPIVSQTLFAVIYENIAEYYWHRIMHLKYFYNNLIALRSLNNELCLIQVFYVVCSERV